MHLAAHFGCDSTLKKLLADHQALVNVEDADSQTPLMVAASAKQGKALLDILQAQPFNQSNIELYRRFCTKLYQQGSVEISQILQAALSSPYSPPITTCATLELHDGLKELIRLGVDINAKDILGDTALIKAANLGLFDILRTLCDANADGTIVNNSLETALICAIQNDKTREACYLVTRFPGAVDIQQNLGRTPAMLAAKKGQIKVLYDLIKAGAQLGSKSHEGKNCLAYAKKSHNKRTVWIVRLATLIHAQRVAHLCTSARSGNARDVIGLICMGQTQLHTPNPDTGMNALMEAASKCRLNTLVPLIEAQAPVDLTNKKGRTAAMLVPTRHEDAAVAITLLMAAAATQAAPADLRPVSPLMVCASDGSLDAVNALLAHSVNLSVNQQDGEGNTALMRAASQGHAHIVTALMNAHASVDIYNNAGQQATDLAAAHVDVMNVLTDRR